MLQTWASAGRIASGAGSLSSRGISVICIKIGFLASFGETVCVHDAECFYNSWERAVTPHENSSNSVTVIHEDGSTGDMLSFGHAVLRPRRISPPNFENMMSKRCH